MRTVSVNYYFHILRILEDLGLDREEISHLAPLHLEDVKGPATRIDIDVFAALLNFAEGKLEDPHIGLSVSQAFRISEYGYGGGIFAMCDTVSHSIEMTIKYASLAHTLGKLRFSPEINLDTGMAKYILDVNFGPEEDIKYRQIIECMLSNYVLTLNWLSWSLAKGVEAVSFRHSAVGPKSVYERALSCSVEFDAPENSIQICKDSLDVALPTANPIKFRSLELKLRHRLSLFNSERAIVPRIKYVLHRIIENKRPTLADVAQELGLSERSLKRNLKQEQSKFQTILKEVKKERCETYRSAGYGFAEIAQMLWYHDQSAFTRAYKQWHGVTPKQHERDQA